MKKYQLIFFTLCIILSSCTKTHLAKEKSQNISFSKKCKNEQELYRSELKLFNSENKNIDSLLTVMNKEIPAFIQDTLFDFYKSIISDANYNIISDSTYTTFGDKISSSKMINQGLCLLEKYFEKDATRIITIIDDDIVSTLDPPFNPIFYNSSDQLVLVQLQWFLGKDHVFYINRHQPIPEYLRTRYDQQYIPSLIFQAIGSYYCSPNILDNKLLTTMINEAKPYFFAEMILPEQENHLIFGSSKNDILFFQKNSKSMWKHILQNQYLFSSASSLKEQYITPCNMTQLGSPGRFGVWIGWQILRAYFNNNNVTFEDVLKEKDYLKILNKSNYKP